MISNPGRATQLAAACGILALFGVMSCKVQTARIDSAWTPRVVKTELKSEVFNNTRTLRVLLPPSYDEPENSERRYPVFYFLDGVAAFDAWGVPEVVADLWQKREIREFIVVGIDNGGSTTESTDPARDRASEYLPYVDQTWTGSPSPEPRGQRFPAFLFDEVMPVINQQFRTETAGANTGLAGDSYAGAVVLYTVMKYPDRIGYALVESPPLHVGNNQLLQDAMTTNRWPKAVYLGVGTTEVDDTDGQVEIVQNVRALHAAIQGVSDETSLHLEIEKGGIHWYTSWNERLPIALRFLLSE
jgi:predicted alpha/beta superfamily hydrolase